MQTLNDTLCKELDKDELNLNSRVLSSSYSQDGKSALHNNWSISHADLGKNSQCSSYDAIIMTAPLSNVKAMKITKNRNLFSLDFIPQKEKVKQPIKGFGVLVPSKEHQNGLKTLGTLFSSMMFPDRAPSDLHLYTTFVGGSRNQELANASTDAVVGSRGRAHISEVIFFIFRIFSFRFSSGSNRDIGEVSLDSSTHVRGLLPTSMSNGARGVVKFPESLMLPLQG
ncbi:hypothetical protein ACFE04_006441 [Oxalis oulophora]